MTKNIARLAAVIFFLYFSGVTQECRPKQRPFIILSCYPMQDALGFLKHALSKCKRVDFSHFDYMELRIGKPLSNGNVTIDNLSPKDTKINIPIRLSAVDLFYSFIDVSIVFA